MERRAGDVVAGLFATLDQAMTARQALHRIGLADSDIDLSRPGPGPYRLEVREAESLGRGVLDGIVVGTILGAVIGALLAVAIVPGALERGAGPILLGISMGAFWGSFFGGLGGMALKAAANDEGGMCELPASSAAVLAVARAGEHAADARKVLRRCGAVALVRATPDLVGAGAPLAATVGVPGGSGHLSLDAASGDADTGVGGHRALAAGASAAASHEESRPIGIPRGAFLFLILFLIGLSVLWANVYLRVLWRA